MTRWGQQAPRELWITGNPEADHLLSTSGNALLVGMTLDQHMSMGTPEPRNLVSLLERRDLGPYAFNGQGAPVNT